MGNGDKGLRQQRGRGRPRRQGRHAFRVFAFPVNGNIGVRVQSVLCKQIPQAEFGRGALAGCGDGFPRQIRHGMNGISVFHNIKHAQGIDRQAKDLAFRLVVQHGGQVRRNAENVQIAFHKRRGQLVGGTGQGQFIGFHPRQICHPHRRGALQRADADGHRGRGGFLCRRRLRFAGRVLRARLAAGGQGQNQQQRQNVFPKFHIRIPRFQNVSFFSS